MRKCETDAQCLVVVVLFFSDYSQSQRE